MKVLVDRVLVGFLLRRRAVHVLQAHPDDADVVEPSSSTLLVLLVPCALCGGVRLYSSPLLRSVIPSSFQDWWSNLSQPFCLHAACTAALTRASLSGHLVHRDRAT